MSPSPRRVAVTRDEGASGPLSVALRTEGFDARLCPVLVERPPADRSPLLDAAARLDEFDWIICASARSVRALVAARQRPWPTDVRTAAVGTSTAAALSDAGAVRPFVASESGAEALWAALANQDCWTGRRVLIPNVRGGRQVLIEGLTAAGATLTIVEAYVMEPRPVGDIAATWQEIAPDCAVVVSPSVATRLTEAVGTAALHALDTIVAMGATTAAALGALGVPCTVPPASDFPAIARHLAAIRASRDGM
jgi:uroporphyrinogen III methyltransferase/synthase